MAEKSCQVNLLKVLKCTKGSQTPKKVMKDESTQCEKDKRSYSRDIVKSRRMWKFTDVLELCNCSESLMKWLRSESLLRKNSVCARCGKEMKEVSCNDRSDGKKMAMSKSIER